MSRVLFVVPPLVGPINPVVGVAAELRARGHEVAWAGHAELVTELAGDEAPVYACAVPDGLGERTADVTGPAALKYLWENVFVPLADAMAPGVRDAVTGFAPDVVIVDQQAVAGALVAEAAGITWITSATTSAELIDPLASMPKVAAWLRSMLDELRQRMGDPAATSDPRFSPHGILAFTTKVLLGDVPLPHERTWLIGPALARRPADPDFPWDWLDPDRRHVLISLGTANDDAGSRFLGECVGALADRQDRVQAVIADPAGALGDVPDNVLVRRHVPQLELLPRLDAVVCHSGHNTVCESLWHGVPLVVAPIRDDQPIIAGQVVAAGAGVRLRFNRAAAERIGASIEKVLDPAEGYIDAAALVADSFRSSGGAREAAHRIESTVTTRVG